MELDSHMEGFEKEAVFKALFREFKECCPELRMRHLKAAIATIAPTFATELFARRVCVRRLRYKGATWLPETEQAAEDGRFKIGKTYISSTFNGATYTFDEYVSEHGEQPIGAVFFEKI